MISHGNTGNAVPDGTHVPIPTTPTRPPEDILDRLERAHSWRSPIIQNPGPDPDAVARLIRLGLLTAPDPTQPQHLERTKRKAPRRRQRLTPGPPPAPAWDVAEAITLAHEHGWTAMQLAEKYGVSGSTIRHQLGRAGATIPKVDPARITPEQAAEVRSLFDQGLPKRAIARKTGRAYTTVLRVTEGMTRARPERHDIGKGRPANTDADEVILTAYRRGDTITAIAETVGRTRSTVRRVLDRHAALDRHVATGGQNKVTEDTQARIVALYVEGNLTAAEVAAHIGVGRSTAYKAIREAGVARNAADAQRIRGKAIQTAHNAIRTLMESNGVTGADVRAWAAATGRPISTRGIPSRALIEAYLLETAHNERNTA